MCILYFVVYAYHIDYVEGGVGVFLFFEGFQVIIDKLNVNCKEKIEENLKS